MVHILCVNHILRIGEMKSTALKAYTFTHTEWKGEKRNKRTGKENIIMKNGDGNEDNEEGRG